MSAPKVAINVASVPTEDSPLIRPVPSIEPPSRAWKMLSVAGLVLALTLSLVAVVVSQSGTSRLQGRTSGETAVLGAPPGVKLGVCYDPVHSWAYPSNMAQVFSQDFPLVGRHFRLVRTFYAVYFGVEVMPYIASAGLSACLGVSIAEGRAEEEKGAAIRAFYEHGANLDAIMVGNEDLPPVGPFSVDDIVGYLNDIRSKGVTVPIGTSQRINEWLLTTPEIDRLAAAVDIIGVNIYPYFSTAHNDGEAWEMLNQPLENMRKQYEAVLRRFPGQEWKVRITETGWPSAGSRNFAQHDATIDQAKNYFYAWTGWACAQPYPSFYYTYWDRRWASSPDYEQFFGVVDADGHPKWPLGNGYC